MICGECCRTFQYDDSETFINYSSINYDIELVKCKHCGAINIVRFIEIEEDDEEWHL